MPDAAAHTRHLPGDRSVAVRVLGQDRRGSPDAARFRVERSVQRVADDRDRRAVFRIGRRQRPRGQAGHAQHRNVVFRVEGDCPGDQPAVGLRLDDVRPVLSGDDVRGGDDDAGCRDPTAPRDPEPASGAEDAHDAGRGSADDGVVDHGRCGRLIGDRRAGDRRERIDAREHVQEPLRRDDVVEATEDLRALNALAQRALVREQQRGRAADPDEREPGGGADHEPARTVQRA